MSRIVRLRSVPEIFELRIEADLTATFALHLVEELFGAVVAGEFSDAGMAGASDEAVGRLDTLELMRRVPFPCAPKVGDDYLHLGFAGDGHRKRISFARTRPGDG